VIAFAGIVPHGEVGESPALQEAMEELGRRCERAGVQTALVVTPHNVHVEGHFAVVTAGRIGPHETERELVAALLAALRDDGLPALGVSYGGNDPADAEMPLDWGTEVPLEFIRAERVVVLAPARDRPLEEHLRVGGVIRRVLEPRSRPVPRSRVALVASADHGHAHDSSGPYGFHPAAASYDERLQEILASNRFDLLPLAELAEDAKADSLWQLLVLQGALGERVTVDLLAYAVPTYYGMLVAELTPPALA